MDWQLHSPESTLNAQEVADEILQIYLKSLQNQDTLKEILAECSMLDYFGICFHGQEEISSHLATTLHRSSYEVSSLSSVNGSVAMDWDFNDNSQKVPPKEDLGVSMFSPPKASFPSLSFETPVRHYQKPLFLQDREINSTTKRNFRDAGLDNLIGNLKKCKMNLNQSGNNNEEAKEMTMVMSPGSVQCVLPSDIKYLSAYGTIRYPNRVLPTADPKRIKHRNLGPLRDRFCQLLIGYQCDPDSSSVTNCKIWVIKYGISSRVTPKNLMKLFDEAELH